MADDMFFTDDMRSLRRGKRIAPRTETCRPCLVWAKDDQGTKFFGVVMDINPYGMRIRMMDEIGQDTAVVVQLMRDEDYEVPLARPIDATVVRIQPAKEDLTDHGVQVRWEENGRQEARPVRIEQRPPVQRQRERMYTLDITVGNRPRRR